MSSHLLAVLLLFSAVACSTAAATATQVADLSSSTADLSAIAVSAATANASATQAALANTTTSSSGLVRWLLRTCARKIVPEVAQEAACKEEDDAFCDGSTAAETVWWTLLRRQFTMPIGLAMGEMVLERLCTILIDS
jgi:hypothetical protein